MALAIVEIEKRTTEVEEKTSICSARSICSDFRRNSPGCTMSGVIQCPNDEEYWNYQQEKALERSLDGIGIPLSLQRKRLGFRELRGESPYSPQE